MDRDDRTPTDTSSGDQDRAAKAAAAAGEGGGDRPDQEAVVDETVTSEDIESDFENLRMDLAKANDRHLRLAAEFDNYRKRIERERSELHAKAQAELTQRLLEGIDDLERVADFGEDTPVAALLQGVQLVEKKLHTALTTLGLDPIDPKGEVFDPASMEALATVEAEHPEEDEVVSDVFQKGYRFKGHLIRPARVRVKKYED